MTSRVMNRCFMVKKTRIISMNHRYRASYTSTCSRLPSTHHHGSQSNDSSYHSYGSIFSYHSVGVLLGMIGLASLALCDAEPTHTLFPPIQPMKSGYLEVGDIHKLYWSTYGNPNGIPVLVLHGGPGAMTSPKHARYFDPDIYHIILFDQRGCGLSKPYGELRENTTWDLVEDIERLRHHLQLKKIMLFGGSWGSTLALTYAMKYVDHVSGMILRGVFTYRPEEVAWYYQHGANQFYPEEWMIYQNAIPAQERDDYIAAYSKRLSSTYHDKEDQLQAYRAWNYWTSRTMKLKAPDMKETQSIIDCHDVDDDTIKSNRIELHYTNNHGFYPYPGYLLHADNIARIHHIPTIIIQGRYDIVCPPSTAFELYHKLHQAELVYTLAGHSGADEDNINHLVKASYDIQAKLHL